MKTFRRRSRKNKITKKIKRGQYRRCYRGGVTSNGRSYAPARPYSAPPPSTRSSSSSSSRSSNGVVMDVEMEEAPPLRIRSGTRKKQNRRNSKTRQKKFIENNRAARAKKVSQKRKGSPQPRIPPPLPPAPGLYPRVSDDFDSAQVPMGRRVRTGERSSNSSHIPMGIPV